MKKRLVPIIVFTLLLTLFIRTVPMPAQERPNPEATPMFSLLPAPPVEFSGDVDSNSPSFWQFFQGQNRLHVVTSWWTPSISRGGSVRRLGAPRAVRFLNSSEGGKWMEAVLQHENGALYGYYHNEPLGLCGPGKKTAPRIGAARSLDSGLSWEDLGIILEVPRTALDCNTPNEYFAGGVGDFTVILDEQQTDAYFFFTSYSGDASRQGVAVARMLWAQRDSPRGNVAVWDGEIWRYPSRNGSQIRRMSEPRPIYPAAVSWHDRSESVDSFWGPSVHWNTFLNSYVMLLNRASDSAWTQEGSYIAFSPVLDDPTCWTKPLKIIDGGPFYPQVMGLERDSGTDKLAGSRSRLFLRGRSEYFLVFQGQN
jgi:hypothetical protein